MEKRQLLTGEIPYVYGQVYNKVLEVIRDCYNSGREELANQLAISAIEYSLTGTYSFADIPEVRMCMTFLSPAIDKSHERYEIKKEITEIDNSLKFEEVSNYLKEGLTQSQIAQNMMVAQSTVSKWINIMRKQYPHLLKGTKYENLSSQLIKSKEKLDDLIEVKYVLGKNIENISLKKYIK